MVDDALLHLHLADVEVALEVLLIVDRVVQAPLGGRVQLHMPLGAGRVFQDDPLHLTALAHRHEERDFGLQTVFLALEHRVPQPVPAYVRVQRRLRRQECRAPRRFPVLLYIEETAALVRTAVVAEPEETHELRVAVEAVAAAGVRKNAKKLLVAEVVDPRKRRFGRRDRIFAPPVVKITVFHIGPSSRILNDIDFARIHCTAFRAKKQLFFSGRRTYFCKYL
ncbi:MAG: hypothetical protein BWY59_02119 [Verrucomicrobia bacterium ADurb.Bin345]|nr:MAG: hypothetical protein BWY59_02119 [Verrucomicrobia bacterium ADurb.Bin345]